MMWIIAASAPGIQGCFAAAMLPMAALEGRIIVG